MTEQAYPLSWPRHWQRTPSHKKQRAQFGKVGPANYGGGYTTKSRLSIADGTKRLLDELGRLGAREIIISTNLRLRRDGLPASDQKEPDDNGVAVYFQLLGKPQVLACDKWDRIADNLAALGAHIDAIRRQERYGVGSLEQAFAGYAALPNYATEPAKRPWRDVLGYPETLEAAEAGYKVAAKRLHPDNPSGSHEAMAELNQAIKEAREFWKAG